MKLSLALLAALGLFSAPAHAANWQIDPSQSSITFAGKHAGQAFTGQFKIWDAAVDFDPTKPGAGSLTARFTAASATTGNAMYDGTLPQADWFDVKNHPHASFTSTAITAGTAPNSFQVAGQLTLRGITQPVSFTFTLDDPAAATVKATANFVIDRLAYDIGRKSDAKAEWVSRDIGLTLNIVAKKKS